MKITLTLKVNNPTQKEKDKSVDVVLSIGKMISKKLGGFNLVKCKFSEDRVSLLLAKF